MHDDVSKFDAPDLQAALRRAIPPALASDALRARIAATMAGMENEPICLPQPQKRAHWWHRRKLAIAAAVSGLVLGGLTFVLTDQEPSLEQTVAVSAEMPMVKAAVAHHEELEGSIQRGLPLERRLLPMPQMSQEMLHYSVALTDADLSPLGWQFVGGKTRRDAPGSFAQLFYHRGAQTLSVFVLPKNTSARESGKYRMNDRLVAMRPMGGGTLCIVGHGRGLKAEDVERVAEFFSR